MLIVGLGNPGPEYAGTRHNVGWEVVDRLARAWGWRWRKGPGRSLVAEGRLTRGPDARELVLVKPQTFMNASGEAVRELLAWRKDAPRGEVVVVHDDLDLPVGRLRIRRGGGSGGHHGMESVLQHAEGDLLRVRIGIGKPAAPEAGADHVLSPFTREEAPVIEEALARAAEAVEAIVWEGLASAMNRYNAKADGE